MRLAKLTLFVALLSPFLLAPAYAQRAGGGGRAGGTFRGGGAFGGGFRGGYYGGFYGYGGRYWGPGIYFGLGGWGYPYWGYPYYLGYPYYAYPYYGGYPYYYEQPYYYPAPPPTPQQNYPPQGQGQPAPPQQPSDPPQAQDQFAAPEQPSDPPPWEFGLGQLLSDPDVRQQLGVTAAQAAKIQQQESDFRKAEVRNRADLLIKRMDLDDLLSAEKPDRSAIDSKLQEIGAAQIALEKSAVDNWLTMQDAITPAQRQKLQQMMKQGSQPVPAGNAAPSASQGGGRGGRGAAPSRKAQGQAPPNH